MTTPASESDASEPVAAGFVAEMPDETGQLPLPVKLLDDDVLYLAKLLRIDALDDLIARQHYIQHLLRKTHAAESLEAAAAFSHLVEKVLQGVPTRLDQALGKITPLEAKAHRRAPGAIGTPSAWTMLRDFLRDLSSAVTLLTEVHDYIIERERAAAAEWQ